MSYPVRLSSSVNHKGFLNRVRTLSAYTSNNYYGDRKISSDAKREQLITYLLMVFTPDKTFSTRGLAV
jgi:hypothetical protein